MDSFSAQLTVGLLTTIIGGIVVALVTAWASKEKAKFSPTAIRELITERITRATLVSRSRSRMSPITTHQSARQLPPQRMMP